MFATIRQLGHDTTYKLKGELVHMRTEMVDAKVRKGITRVKVVPYIQGKMYKNRGRWLDWNTLVEVVEEY